MARFPYKELTFEDRKIIEESVKKNLTGLAISSILKKGDSTVNHELRRNESPYCAEKAQKRAQEMRKRKANIHAKNLRENHLSLRLKIEGSSEVINIIFEQLESIDKRLSNLEDKNGII